MGGVAVEQVNPRNGPLAGTEELKVVDLPATEHTWAGLAAHAAERLADYRLVSWAGPHPGSAG